MGKVRLLACTEIGDASCLASLLLLGVSNEYAAVVAPRPRAPALRGPPGGECLPVLLAACLAGAGRLLVAWMLTPDDGSRDGGLRSYLRERETWSRYDPGLFSGLRIPVETEAFEGLLQHLADHRQRIWTETLINVAVRVHEIREF